MVASVGPRLALIPIENRRNWAKISIISGIVLVALAAIGFAAICSAAAYGFTAIPIILAVTGLGFLAFGCYRVLRDKNLIHRPDTQSTVRHQTQWGLRPQRFLRNAAIGASLIRPLLRYPALLRELTQRVSRAQTDYPITTAYLRSLRLIQPYVEPIQRSLHAWRSVGRALWEPYRLATAIVAGGGVTSSSAVAPPTLQAGRTALVIAPGALALGFVGLNITARVAGSCLIGIASLSHYLALLFIGLTALTVLQLPRRP